MNKRYFFDTSSLLSKAETIFKQAIDSKTPFFISSITLKELEHIKSSAHKDADVKYSARLILSLLEQHPECFEIIIHKLRYERDIVKNGYEITDDTKILSDAILTSEKTKKEIHFITEDLSLKRIGEKYTSHFFKIGSWENEEEYTGYLKINPTDEQLSSFYA